MSSSIVLQGVLASSIENAVWIAHRGGVTHEGLRSNSLPALKEAARRGYQGIEIDVRPTRDGGLIAHHDSHFESFFSNSCRLHGFLVCGDFGYKPMSGECREVARIAKTRMCAPSEMTLNEVLRLKDREGQPLMELENLLEHARFFNLKLMLDLKRPSMSEHAMKRLIHVLRTTFPDGDVYLIGSVTTRERIRKFHVGKAALTPGLIRVLRLLGIHRPDENFIFTHGISFKRSAVNAARDAGVDLVVSINLSHYSDSKDPMSAAVNDLYRAYHGGARIFQIDSEILESGRTKTAWLMYGEPSIQ